MRENGSSKALLYVVAELFVRIIMSRRSKPLPYELSIMNCLIWKKNFTVCPPSSGRMVARLCRDGRSPRHNEVGFGICRNDTKPLAILPSVKNI